MSLTARQRTAIAIAFLVVAGLGFAFWRFFIPQLQIYAETEAEVQNLARKLDSLKGEYNNYSNPAHYLDELKPAVASWDDAYSRRVKIFAATLRKVPPGQRTPEFYFNEQWKETRDILLEKARRKNVIIPPDIGFSSAIPPRDQVGILLNQLSNTEYILNLAIDCGVLQLNSFSVGAPIDRNGFIRVIPFQIGFTAPVDAFKKFLYSCGYGSQYFKVETVSVSVTRDPFGATNVQVQLVLTTTWILEDKRAVEAAAEEAAPGMPGMAGIRELFGGRRPDFEGLRSRRDRDSGEEGGFARRP